MGIFMYLCGISCVYSLVFGPVIWGNFCHQGQGFMGFLIKRNSHQDSKQHESIYFGSMCITTEKDKKQLNIVLAQRDMQIHETGHIFKLSKF